MHHERVHTLVNGFPGERQFELHDASASGQPREAHERARAAQVADERCRYRAPWLSNDDLEVGVKPLRTLGADLATMQQRVEALAAELVAIGERGSKLISHRLRNDAVLADDTGSGEEELQVDRRTGVWQNDRPHLHYLGAQRCRRGVYDVPTRDVSNGNDQRLQFRCGYGGRLDC